MDTIRTAFENMTESLYEGDFAKYYYGDYVNETQQAQWEGFHDGWKAVTKKLAKPVNVLIGWAQSGEVISDDAPFSEWAAKLITFADEAEKAWDSL